MLLGYTEPEQETTIQIPHMGRRAWRWMLSITWLSLAVTRQINFGLVPNTDWHASGAYFTVELRPLRWGYGFSQFYYDGMHNIYRCGPLCIAWCA